MFSEGQIIFAILFIIGFSILLAIAYKKDYRLHQKYYKGSIWVLLAFICFIGLIAAIKYFFI